MLSGKLIASVATLLRVCIYPLDVHLMSGYNKVDILTDALKVNVVVSMYG